MYSSNMI